MSPSITLGFALRTSPNVRTVHLIGSWDNYQRQLPLSSAKGEDAKPGSWKGTFRFQGSQTLQPGSRYWYYYIVDGYHVSHDPAKEWTTEKTTGRKLNILNVAGGPTSTAKPTTTKQPTMSMSRTNAAQPLHVQTSNLNTHSHGHHRRTSREIVTGRPMSPSKIACPRPQKPYASRHLREADYEMSPIDDLEERFASTRLSDRSLPRGVAVVQRSPYMSSTSPSDLSDSSMSSGGGSFSHSASSSSCSSVSPRPACRCERYGVTREGRRVKLDCGGRRCGSGDSSASSCSSSGSDCASEEEEEEEEGESEDERVKRRMMMSARVAVNAKPSSGGGAGARRPLAVEKRRPIVIERRPGGRH